MLGWFRNSDRDFRAALSEGNYNRFAFEKFSSATMKGIVFERTRGGNIPNAWDGQMTIAALETQMSKFPISPPIQPDGNGSEVWSTFSKDGTLATSTKPWLSSGESLAGVHRREIHSRPRREKNRPMVLSWDLPVVEFGSGRKWYRHYTDFYGTNGANSWAIARDGLQNAAAWSDAIAAWQAPYINDESKPEWYRGMLFNELYVLADGGSFWGRPVGADSKTPSTYSFVECFRLSVYETLDVRFYGSLPLVKFWPEIDKQVMRDFADTVPKHLDDRMVWIWKSLETGQAEFRERKTKGAVPHDMGVPNEDPFFQINQFSWQDTNGWKDLNSKFALMVYRDYVLTGSHDTEFLNTAGPPFRKRLPISENTIATTTAFQTTTAIPIRRTIRGSCAATALTPEVCGSRRCAPRKRSQKNSATKKRHALSRMVCERAEQLHQQTLEWKIFPVRHRKRIQRQHSIRSTRRPVVCGYDRTRRHRSERNDGEVFEKYLRLQRHEIRER